VVLPELVAATDITVVVVGDAFPENGLKPFWKTVLLMHSLEMIV